MKIRQTYGSAFIIVIVSIVLILPLLAYLQYTWLGQLSKEEYQRMQENIRVSAFHLSMEFSREVTEIINTLDGKLIGSDENVYRRMRQRILEWKMQSSQPSFISTEIKIERLPFPEQMIRINLVEESTIHLLKDFSAIAITIENQPDRAVIIPVNMKYISSTIIPKIIQTNLLQDLRSEYDIVIINKRGSLLYSNIDTSSQDVLENADVVIPFLTFPPKPLGDVPTDRPPREFDSPGERNRPRSFDRVPQELERRQDFSPPQRDIHLIEREFRMRESGLFEMRLRHRNGSLEMVVNNNRLRNLGISFGVLILLGASIVFLLISVNRAQRLARQQLEFVAGVSHELRTPLTVLKSAGENLADGVIQGEERSRQYGEVIKSEVIRLSEMVEKALAYAGIKSGKQNYELRLLDIESIIAKALQNAKKLLPIQDFTIEQTVGHNLPQVIGDAAALQSAIENLIINGVKYSSGNKWIKIEAHHIKNKKDTCIEIKIKDHGIGITHADISNIFKPFYRGCNAIDEQVQGSGIGLSITKHIIESHGGRITVSSILNEGSVFTVLLPVAAFDKEKK
jgi:signal transduction histidine kinase